MLDCTVCGEKFYARPAEIARGRAFCSYACMGIAKTKERTCGVCGKPFTNVNRGPRKTCSVACSNEAKARAKRGDNPAKSRAVQRKMAATRRVNQLAAEADVPGERREFCERPGCGNRLSGQLIYCSTSCHYQDRGRRGRSPDGYRREDWNAVALGGCAHPDCNARAVHRHHVVFRQHVLRAGGDRHDPANMATLCLEHHVSVHARQDLPMVALSDAAIRFATDLLGPAAESYIRRRYSGDDPRVDAIAELPSRERPRP